MNRLFVTLAAVAACMSLGTAMAEVTADELRQVSDQTYQQLGDESVPAGRSDDAVVEQVFTRNYTNVIGSEPDFDTYLQWKYMTNYPASMSQGTAAVRQEPDKTTDKKHECPGK